MKGLIFLTLTLTSACGISTPQGYVLGTTGYLAEYNRAGKLEHHTNEDRAQLSSLIERR